MNSALSIRRSLVIFSLLTFVFSVLGAEVSSAQEKYPSRDIDLILPFAPGGIVDLTGRFFADKLSKVLGVMVVPVNKPGASGITGTMFALQAKRDGYTILAESNAEMVMIHYILPDVPFVCLRDFIPICLIAISPKALFVRSESTFKTFDDFIDYARKNPGKLSYGSAGTGSSDHLVVEQLQDAAKVKFTHVPFKGGGEVIPAVLGGHVDFGSTSLVTAASNLKAGTFRGLVISGKERAPLFPDIPTYREKGYTQPFVILWNGLFVATGTPQPIVDVLAKASEKVLKSKDFNSSIENIGGIVKYMELAEFRKLLEEEDKNIRTIVKQIGLKPISK
jgi:tripartite-type tricarboxylate transporter receptor subunit TctC